MAPKRAPDTGSTGDGIQPGRMVQAVQQLQRGQSVFDSGFQRKTAQVDGVRRRTPRSDHPQARKLKPEIRELLSKTIFGGFQLELDQTGPQKRLVLRGNGTRIPYMVWSAGQREFVPLLLGLYRLLPSITPTRLGSVKWVMIEELEMGLHPKAIAAVFFIVLDLLWHGYKVCLSTHSPRFSIWFGRFATCGISKRPQRESWLSLKCSAQAPR